MKIDSNLSLSNNTSKFLIMIKGKSKVKFRLGSNHKTTLYFKCSLKQKRNLRVIFLWGLDQILNQTHYITYAMN